MSYQISITENLSTNSRSLSAYDVSVSPTDEPLRPVESSNTVHNNRSHASGVVATIGDVIAELKRRVTVDRWTLWENVLTGSMWIGNPDSPTTFDTHRVATVQRGRVSKHARMRELA